VRIAIHDFVRRQTQGSRFSSLYGVSWEMLAEYAHRQLSLYDVEGLRLSSYGKVRQGYREGVVLVDIDASLIHGVRSSVVQLNPGDQLLGCYEARREGETPRKAVWTSGHKMKARSAFLVLYSSELLAEDGDNSLAAVSGNYEIISLNASPLEDEMPIAPGVLIANHLEEDGGTATQMTDAEFVAQLRISRAYWKDKALCG